MTIYFTIYNAIRYFQLLKQSVSLACTAFRYQLCSLWIARALLVNSIKFHLHLFHSELSCKWGHSTAICGKIDKKFEKTFQGN